jgi:Class II flagellar assembly regulator
MRIQGTIGTAAVATPSSSRRAAAGAFSMGEGSDARAIGNPAPLRTVGGIDALLALQGIEEPLERRKYAVKRGRIALEALDELKLGLLGGPLSPATLAKLNSAAAYLKDGSGDAGLDGILGEIELRVEVEIAKMAPR